MSMSLISILITCFEICRHLSTLTSSDRWPLITKLNLSMLRRRNRIVLMDLVIIMVTCLEIG